MKLTSAALCLLLTACAGTVQAGKEQPKPATKETKTMTDSKPKMKLSQKEILTRLLDLMANAESFEKDFSPQNLEKVFGVPMKDRANGDYGYGERMPEDWSYGFEVYKVPPERKGSIFSLTFGGRKNTSQTRPDMSTVCEMTMDNFGIRAKEKGFILKPIRAWGRAPILAGISIEKGRLRGRISLTARMGPNDDRLHPGPACIEMIQIYPY